MLKKILIPLTILLLIIVVIYAKKTYTTPTPTPVITPFLTPSVSMPAISSLYFSPDTIASNKGQDNEVTIQINSQGKLPTLLQLELAYDPSVLTQVTLFPGDIFPKSDILLNENDEKTGRISFAFGLPASQNPRTASGNAARIKFRINKNTLQNQTTIYFLPKTSILSGDTTIPLEIATGLKIILNQKNQIPSISATPI